MKTIVKVALPVLAFTLASAAAFNTNESKISEAENALAIQGFIQDPSPTTCLEVEVDDCTTLNTGEICMSNEATPRQVWHKNSAHACVVELYRVLH